MTIYVPVGELPGVGVAGGLADVDGEACFVWKIK